MHDEYDARLWAEHGRAFTGWLGSLADQAWVAMKRLNEIEFEAPWRQGAAAAETSCRNC